MKLYHKILFLTLVQLGAIFSFGIYQIQSLYVTQKTAFEQKKHDPIGDDSKTF